jgi:hypothetical protein
MKVCIFDAKDPEMPFGMGDLCRREDLVILSEEDENTVLCTIPDHPVIIMEETGDILYGIQCWWVPV